MPSPSARAWRLTALLLLLPSGGCILAPAVALGGVGATVGAVSAPLPPDTSASPLSVGAAVRVEYAAVAPRVARDPRGAAVAVGSVRTAFGRIALHRHDSLWVRLSEVRDDQGRVRHYAGGRAPLLPVAVPDDASVRVLALAPRMRERALLGAGMGFVVGVVAMVGVCARANC